MIPIVARLKWTDVPVLIVEFVGVGLTSGAVAVVVLEGGQMDSVDVRDLIVERPTGAFPSGYQFSDAQAPPIETAEVARR